MGGPSSPHGLPVCGVCSKKNLANKRVKIVLLLHFLNQLHTMIFKWELLYVSELDGATLDFFLIIITLFRKSISNK